MQKLERSGTSKAAAVEWRRRELHRRELSVLSSRDFGDLPVPQSLINEEIRRWPWQKWSQQWSQVTYKRGHPCDGIGRTR